MFFSSIKICTYYPGTSDLFIKKTIFIIKSSKIYKDYLTSDGNRGDYTGERIRMKENIKELKISSIERLDNSRIRLDPGDLTELITDIKHRGLLQPIGVLKVKHRFVLRYGERRLEACKLIGWKTIPAIVFDDMHDLNDFLADNTAENIHRKDLTPVELGRVCAHYLKKGVGYSEIASILSIPKKRVLTAMKIFTNVPKKYESDIQYIPPSRNRDKRGAISVTVANTILGLRVKKKDIGAIYEQAKKHQLSTSDIRVIGILINKGYSINEALKKRGRYKVIHPKIMVDKHRLKRGYIKKLREILKGSPFMY